MCRLFSPHFPLSRSIQTHAHRVAAHPPTHTHPATPLTPQAEDSGLPFNVHRRQFPIRLAFAYTINKAQGQTLDRAGIFLRPEGAFGHGHLYTGLSRVGVPGGVFVTIDGGGMKKPGDPTGVYTPNVVYKELLR